MGLRGVRTKGKMTLERQIKASMEGSVNRLSVVDFFMGARVGADWSYGVVYKRVGFGISNLGFHPEFAIH